ncbi:hypothetical protein AVEN_239763-1 [Araneus ventricosus]|uniref:Uncharacterized protein n=1 Tax=Araneus ventricosus TaxID=182803 RepID=A0A4Y2IHZ9_ARAVE|nr:hypothetical protein AVEN_239763-1 [Araneus ventricosus]
MKVSYTSSVVFLLLKGSPFLGEYGCPNPEVPKDLYSLQVYPPLCLMLFDDPFHALMNDIELNFNHMLGEVWPKMNIEPENLTRSINRSNFSQLTSL